MTHGGAKFDYVAFFWVNEQKKLLCAHKFQSDLGKKIAEMIGANMNDFL
jgi:hypothetical protein